MIRLNIYRDIRPYISDNYNVLKINLNWITYQWSMGAPSRVPLDGSNNNRNLPLNDVYILVHHSESRVQLEICNYTQVIISKIHILLMSRESPRIFAGGVVDPRNYKHCGAGVTDTWSKTFKTTVGETLMIILVGQLN